MSGKIMGAVWELALSRPKQVVLLAMADHADHEGRNVRPSVPLVAWKTGYSERQVQRIIGQLISDGLLVRQAKATSHSPAVYQICVSAGKPKEPLERRHNIVTPEVTSSVTPARPADAPDVTPQVTSESHPTGDIRESPDPSDQPLKEPSKKPNADARESSSDLELQLILFAILRVTGLDYRLVDGVMGAALKWHANKFTADQVAATWYLWRDANQWKLKTDPGRRPSLDEVNKCLGLTLGGNAFKYDPDMETENIIRQVRASGDFAALLPGYVPALEAGYEDVEI